MVHDERSEAAVGDVVEFAGCRPLSRRKAHVLTRVLRPAGIVGTVRALGSGLFNMRFAVFFSGSFGGGLG
jgi:hypothetical protein